jgi:hypothetical protein
VLRGECTDTAVMRDYDSLTSLFTHTEATVTAPRTGRRPIRHHPRPTTRHTNDQPRRNHDAAAAQVIGV